MATIGHTLVGLAIAELAPAESRGGAMRHTWPGFMVLMGNLVDLVEWAIMLVAPTYFDQHYVTNSVTVTAGISAIVCFGLAFFTKLRKPGAYVLVVLAIFSHPLLDDQIVRNALADAYAPASELEAPNLYRSVLAEVWLYGLLFLSVGLLQASRRKGCPKLGRIAARVLVALAIFAAMTRHAAVWAPVYALAGLHALLMIRRDLKWQSLWNLVPPLPVFALLVVELWAGSLYDQAVAMDRAGNYPAAAAMYRRAIAMPTRSQNLGAYLWLSECQRRESDFAGAEATLVRALRVTDQPWWARSKLARLYAHSSVRGTTYYQPDMAREMLEQVIRDRAPADAKEYARFLLNSLRKRGYVD
jgi:tetratricopeptide (TPR) repeat protein